MAVECVREFRTDSTSEQSTNISEKIDYSVPWPQGDKAARIIVGREWG